LGALFFLSLKIYNSRSIIFSKGSTLLLYKLVVVGDRDHDEERVILYYNLDKPFLDIIPCLIHIIQPFDV
jgi:hypothetical protein